MSVISDGVEILGLISKAANAPLYAKVGKLIDEARDLYAERESLEREVKELKRQLQFKGSVVRIDGRTYVDGDDEPVCSRCAEVDHRPVHYSTFRDPKMGNMIICPQCKAHGEWPIKRSALKTN